MIFVHSKRKQMFDLAIDMSVDNYEDGGWRAQVIDRNGRRIIRTGFYRSAELALAAALREYADRVEYWWPSCENLKTGTA